MPVHVRVCRDCGEEYRPEIVTCVDCGGKLEDRFLGDEAVSGTAPPSPTTAPETGPDLSQHRPVFASGHARDLIPFAEALEASGIAFHFVETPAEEERRAASYSLLVHESDAAAALHALSPLLGLPGPADAPPAVEAPFEDGRGYTRCPACGQQQAAGALECSECGLALGAEDEG